MTISNNIDFFKKKKVIEERNSEWNLFNSLRILQEYNKIYQNSENFYSCQNLSDTFKKFLIV